MASQPDFLQHCFQEAIKAAVPALERCIETAIAALQAAETQSMKTAERDELALAWRALLDHKPAWARHYPAELLLAFQQETENATRAIRPDTAVTTGTAKTTAPSTAGRTGSNAMDMFSLVDDAAVVQAIESARLLQHILPRVEQTLAELDTLVSSLQGLDNVRPELNPLRPEVLTRVLQDLMNRTAGANPEVVSVWIRQLADPLGKELKGIYEKLLQMLEQAHIPAAQYRVLQTPASAMGRQGKSTGGAARDDNKKTGTGGGGSAGSGGHGGYAEAGEAPRQPSQYADLSNYEIRDELFQDFLFHGGSNANHGLAPSYYATVEEELTALKAAPDSSAAPLEGFAPAVEASYQALAAVDRPRRFVDVSSPLSAQLWGVYGRSRERAIVRTQLKKEATKVGQVLGLEVVRKLVTQVAQDPRLLVPVREAIVALEPSLLRLAMVDPRFFSDEGHPGRRLMERVAQRSFKYNDEYSVEFRLFFEPVTQAFNELNGLSIEDSRPFGMALATLEYAWDEQDQIELENKNKVLRALHFAEDRQERADQIAFDLSARSDLDNVPGVVLDFLFGPWSLAMAHAKLSDQRNQIDPEGFGSVVPDLLWSVKRDVTLKRPARLIEMIPGMLVKLHSGLDMLGQDPKENQTFFDALMKLHQPVLKLRRLKSKRDAEESGAMPLEPEELPATPEQRLAKVAEQPWLGRDDLDAAGFEDTQPTAPGELDIMEDSRPAGMDGAEPEHIAGMPAAAAAGPGEHATTPSPDLNNTPTSAEAEAILLGLRTGSWVDLYSKRHWLRAQLIWASTKGTLFMFLSHGGQPHSMTKRSCEKLIMQRWLRPVDTHAVIGHALDAVASEASRQTPSHTYRKTGAHASPAALDEPETV